MPHYPCDIFHRIPTIARRRGHYRVDPANGHADVEGQSPSAMSLEWVLSGVHRHRRLSDAAPNAELSFRRMHARGPPTQRERRCFFG
mmetsp:Transcript_27426/g.83447  ORF Transcript_27426/g.83447 Transcript_27426/m.83447 type:complete len:87 (+) Transcript_27426:734-994(+)